MNIKKIKMLIIILFIILLLIIGIFCCYIFGKTGNNSINESDEGILQYILNIKEYKTKAEVIITSNKNTNKYIIKQEIKDNKYIQEIIEPANIAGVITEYDGNNLKILNTNLNLQVFYQKYDCLVDNALWLDDFILNYKNNYKKDLNIKNSNLKNVFNENEIILELKDEKANDYNRNKMLYIDKKTKKPTKMIVHDINQNITIYILYSEMEIS